ncbi:DUF7305 domain-containing protein [Pseudoduganella sp. R-34]|uniref:DUF7305 domain-containing protein n=1 Tax=Pseudoduganella sp. R-34 TaxID=3404062 RepID=UPI003CF3171F
MKPKFLALAAILTVPAFANATPLTLFAGNNVTLEQGSKVTGDVGAKGNVTVKYGSQVTGNVAAGRNITLEQNSQIKGNATAGNQVEVKYQANVTGNVSGKTNSPTLNTLPPATDFKSGGNAYGLKSGATAVLAGGQYGNVNLEYDSTLKLTAGTYYFDSLTVGAESAFIFDLSGGAIKLFIKNHVNIGSNFDFEMLNGTANDIYTETTGNWTQGAWGEWFGTLFASGANSNMHFNQGNKLGGIFMAGKNIQLDLDTIVTAMPEENSKVPVPGSLPLLAIGLASLALLRRRNVG